MRTLIALAVGFWMARQYYIHFDKKQAHLKAAGIKKRLKQFFLDDGMPPSEAEAQAEEILKEIGRM